MGDFESFSSYELTHENKNKKASKGGCLSSCFTIIVTVLGIIGLVVAFCLLPI